MELRSIATARDAADRLLPHFAAAHGEKIVVLHLDSHRRLLGVTEYPGTIDGADLPLRAIIGEALRLGAAGMIVAHNHPSGDSWPSGEDVDATRLLGETGRALGITLHDHLIFTGGACSSFRALGLL